MLPVGWSWAPLAKVWKLMMMKKCTSASQELLEMSSNEQFNHPDCPQQVLWDSTGNWSPWQESKLSMWQKFVRTQQPSLQTTACLKPGWGQTTRRGYSSLSTRRVFHLQTYSPSPLPLPLSSPSPSTPTFSGHNPFSFLWFPRCSRAQTREMLGGETRERGGSLNIVAEIKSIYLRGAIQQILHTGDTDSLDLCR